VLADVLNFPIYFRSMATYMVVDKTGNPITHAECSTVFISCKLHSLTLRLGRRKGHTYDETSNSASHNSAPSVSFCLFNFVGGSLTLFALHEYLGSVCVRNVCTNTVSEPCDMLCRITGTFIRTAFGTPNINTYVNN